MDTYLPGGFRLRSLVIDLGADRGLPGEVLEVFLRRLGVSARDVPVTTEERSGVLRQVLASRRVLMVLDNARSEGQVRPLLPGAGGSLVLVTSRSVLPGLEADARISLDVLPEGEAIAMLAGLAGAARAGGEPRALGELAGLCGRLPLALRIAGQVLATHPSWPVSRLVGMLAGSGIGWSGWGRGICGCGRRSRCPTSRCGGMRGCSGCWACIRARTSPPRRRRRWPGSMRRRPGGAGPAGRGVPGD